MSNWGIFWGLVVLFLLVLAQNSRSSLLVNTTWADADRTNTALPSSCAWWSSATGTTNGALKAAAGSLSGSPTNTAALWVTYFTTNGAPPVSLNVGDTLNVTLKLSLSGVAGANSANGFRMAVANTYDSTALRATNDAKLSNGGSFETTSLGTNVQGYALFQNMATIFKNASPMSILIRTNLADGSLLGTNTDWDTLATGPGDTNSFPGFSKNTTYQLTLNLQRIAASSLSISAVWSNTATSITLTTTVTNTSATNFNFDTIAILGSSGASSATNFTFTLFQVAKVNTTNYLHFNDTSVGASALGIGPVNPANGVTLVSGTNLAAGDRVVFDGLVIDTSPGTNDAWGAVELNGYSGGFCGLTESQCGVLLRYNKYASSFSQIYTNGGAGNNFSLGAGVAITNRVRIELTATQTGSATNMNWLVELDQGLTGAFTTSQSGTGVTFTNNLINLTFGSYTDPTLFSDNSPHTTNYFHFSSTPVATNASPANPANGATSISGTGFALNDQVVFDGLVIDTNPGTRDAWGAVELNANPAGYYGLTLDQLGVLTRYNSAAANYLQLWTNAVQAANFPVVVSPSITNRVRIQLTATEAGSTTNMNYWVQVDQGLTGAFTTSQSGTGLTFTNNNISLAFGSYTDPSLFSDYSLPMISVQPASQTVTATSNATFSVSAAGAGPLSYQWYFNGSVVAGITAGSYTLTNLMATNAGNYTVTIGNSAGSVTSSVAVLMVNKATGTVTLGSLNQTYGGSPKAATATTSPSGLPVNFTYNGFSNAPTNAGSYTVIGTISDANYQGSATNTLVIAAAPVTITSGVTANNKTYDGTTTAAIISNSVVLAGVVAEDIANVRLSTNGYTASFATSSVANGNAVTVSGLTLTGSAAANYTLTQPTGLTANITAATVAIASGISANNKTYNGTTTATISSNNVSLSGVVAGDTANVKLSTNGYTASFTTASVANGKAVIVSGLTLTGSAAANYALTQPTGLTANLNAAPLTVTANNTNRIYGVANPALTASYTGFVNSETASLVQGTPGFSTSATNSSPVGAYAITPSVGSLAATNYSFTTFNNGTLTINQAGSTLVVTTSANPSPTGSNVTLTATLTAVSPASGTPTGTVQFLADGGALGAPASLSGGVASLTTNGLAHGTHTLTAHYAGDVNFTGSTNTLSPNQVIDRAPLAGADPLVRYSTCGVKQRLSGLLAQASDPDGDAITLASVTAASVQGGTVSTNFGWVLYTQPTGYTNADSFTYVISDGTLQTTGTVAVAIINDTNAAQNIEFSQSLGNGTNLTGFLGIPGRTYSIQYTTNLATAAWQTLGTATANVSGQFQYPDVPGTNLPARIYRSTYP
jgi:hypothetical protein